MSVESGGWADSLPDDLIAYGAVDALMDLADQHFAEKGYEDFIDGLEPDTPPNARELPRDMHAVKVYLQAEQQGTFTPNDQGEL